MKPLIKPLLAALILWCVAAPARANDLGIGFLGARWGSAAAEQKGLSQVGSIGRISFYIHPDRVYSIYGTEVPVVIYGYFDDKLFAVYVHMEGIDVFSQIRSYVQQKYGIPRITRESRGDLTTHSWKAGETRIKLKHYQTSGKLKISFYYLPLTGRANQEMDIEGEEPHEPIFPLNARRQREAIQHMEFLSF
jgi:hypothetical protein